MIISIFCILLISYLLGSIPSSVWIGKLFYGIDVRKQGSGNAGTTNTIRVLGYKAGIPVFIIDVVKGWLAIFLTKIIFESISHIKMPDWLPLISAVAIVSGHVFPVFAGFHGGKGVAALLGVGLGIFPLATLTALCVFIVVLLCSGYVSLGSIAAAVSFPFILIFLFPSDNFWYAGLSIAIAVFLPLIHIKNIKRLINGTENRFLKKRNKKKTDYFCIMKMKN